MGGSSRSRRISLLLVAVLAGHLASSPIVRSQGEPYAEIHELLVRRAQAMLAGDETAFMDTIDRADAAFVDRQRRLFQGYQQIGLAGYRLDITDRYWPELTTDREVARYGEPAQPTVLHVEERYRLAGYDQQMALDDLYLTFVRRGGEWRIVSDTDLDDLTLYSGRKLWELGPIVTRRSEHFLYVSHPDLASRADAILGAAERALGTVEASWSLPWSKRTVILAPSYTEELRRIIQATFDLDTFVAFASSGLDRARDWDLVGHRIILNWPNFSNHSEEGQQEILAHELLHIATREYAGPAVSAFVDEGIAQWVAGSDSTYEVAQDLIEGTFDREFPREFEFITGEQDDIIGAYQESYTAAAYAADRYGEDALADFYRLLGKARLAPGTPRYQVGRAMHAAFGLTLEAFEDRWADWVEDSV